MQPIEYYNLTKSELTKFIDFIESKIGVEYELNGKENINNTYSITVFDLEQNDCLEITLFLLKLKGGNHGKI